MQGVGRNPHRSTLVLKGTHEIKMGDCHIQRIQNQNTIGLLNRKQWSNYLKMLSKNYF